MPLGLVRADGSEKPVVAAIREFARALATRPAEVAARPRISDVSADAYHAAPAQHFQRLYSRWLETRALP